jgi:TRAP-type C4-dicarboxylate transport system substrate-binding protein
LLILAAAACLSAQTVDIKMATLAPKGSPWFQVLEKMNARWQQISGNKVRLILYSGTMGDEPEIVNKLRVKQIQAVALSGAGMSDIEPGVMCLQIPRMFDSYEELDYVRDRVAPRLEKLIEAKGYLVLNWGDAGWVHVFSRTPVARLDELRKLKLFTWAGNTDELELWKANGFNAISMPATDIVFGLANKLIDAVPTTPLYAEWNQCFTMAKYMSDIKWAPLVGATIVSKAAWERVPAASRDAMLKAARDAGEEMRTGIRSMGDKAIAQMTAGMPGKTSQKLTVVHVDDAARADWQKQTEAAYPKIRGKLVPPDLFDEVQRLRNEHRARKGGK